MVDFELKRRIKLYSPDERSRSKAEPQRADQADVDYGYAEAVQEGNRSLSHASEFVFPDEEKLLPSE